MLDFQQKRKIRNIAYNKITLIIIFLCILVVARSTWIVFAKKQSSEEMKNIALQNVERLWQRSDELESKIQKLDTVSGTEEEIRLKFDVVKDRENMVIIVDDNENGESTTSPKLGFWQKIIDFFLK